nr:IS1 family transposase [Nostoc sp. SerVER01]MDZ8016866.1 IS1 family transposase [Nostoc sp. SerVER01]
MQCPRCASTHIRKNGRKNGKQNYICVVCGRQFID